MRALLAVVVVLALHLAGCVGLAGMAGGYVKAYDGPEKPDSEVAVLFTLKATGDTALLSKVDDETYGDDFLRGFPRVTKILPGRRKVTVKCFLGGSRSFPSLTGNFEAGHTYQLGCWRFGGDLGASFDDKGVFYQIPKR